MERSVQDYENEITCLKKELQRANEIITIKDEFIRHCEKEIYVAKAALGLVQHTFDFFEETIEGLKR